VSYISVFVVVPRSEAGDANESGLRLRKGRLGRMDK
jgi:hypothetical protein